MIDNHKTPDGVQLVKSDTFWPEGRWFFVRDLATPLIWGRTEGWKKYTESNRADGHFHSKEEALRMWSEAHRDDTGG